MKDDKKESGEELIDIDEKGNPIEKDKENKEKESKPKIPYKIIITIILYFILLICCYLFLSKKKLSKMSSIKQL